MVASYDEEKIKKFLDKFEGKEKEEMRKKINGVSQMLNRPIEEVTNILLLFKQSTDTAANSNPECKKLNKGIHTSFVASIMSNLQEVFEFDHDLMRELLETALAHNKRLSEQENI